MQVARHIRPEGHNKVWAVINYFFRGHCHLLLGMKQDHPLYSPYGLRLGYLPSEAWLVEQKALCPKLFLKQSWLSVSLKDSNPHSAD